MSRISGRSAVRRPVGIVIALSVVITAVVVIASVVSPDTAVFDQSPIANYVVITVENDLGSPVTADLCGNSRCSLIETADRIAAGGSVRDGVNNASPGTATFVITRAGRRVSCLKLRYLKGQRQAAVKISDARQCRSSSGEREQISQP